MTPSSGPLAPPSPADDAGPIDLDHLSRQTFGDQDLQAELLGLFARQAKDILAALGSGTAALQAADLLHTLCGSARAVGSWRVAAAAEDMERSLRQTPGDASRLATPDGLAALGRSVGQACAAIDDLSQAAGG